MSVAFAHVGPWNSANDYVRVGKRQRSSNAAKCGRWTKAQYAAEAQSASFCMAKKRAGLPGLNVAIHEKAELIA